MNYNDVEGWEEENDEMYHGQEHDEEGEEMYDNQEEMYHQQEGEEEGEIEPYEYIEEGKKS